MNDILDAPITRLGLSDDDAKKVSEALQVETVRDLALNQHFLLAQNCYLIAETTAKPRELSEKKHPFFELVASIAGATVLLGALLYVAGWSYLYQYYKSFGVRISELNLPFYDALVYSLTVIFKGFWSGLLLLLLIAVIGWVLSTKWLKEKVLTPLGLAVALIVMLLVGYGLSRRGSNLGQAQAREDMRETTKNLPNVWLNLAAPAGEDFGVGGYKILIYANQRYYIFKPLKDLGQTTNDLDVIVVPESQVKNVRIQRGIA